MFRTVIVVVLFKVLIALALLVGWGMNVYKFASSDFEEPYKAEIIRGVAIAVAPIGGIIGYMDIGEESDQ